MRAGTASALALVALLAGSICAPSASAGFVPALGSPFAAGAPARALDVADVDGDFDLDVVAGALRRFHNDGTGRLGSSLPIGAPGAVEGVAGGDLDGDGRRDWVAIAPGSPRTLRAYTALAGGGYDEDVLLADAGAAVDVAVADLDGLGGPDIALAHSAGGANVTVLLDDGAGGYDTQAYASGLPAPADLAVGDLTGDGARDLALAGGSASVATLANEGDGSFASATSSPTGALGTAERIALGRLVGDAALDALVADAGGASALLVLRGDGGGLTQSGRWGTGLPAAAPALALGDLNGDGRTDAVAGAGGGFAALLGTGTGAFAPLPGSPFATGAAGVAALAVADMNGDRQRDVVAAAESGSLAVALNTDTGLMEATPGAVAFGALPALAPAVTRTVTFRSTRGQLQITRADVYGPGVFSAGGGCVGRTLLLGQACTMTVTFTPPRAARQRVALLSLDANAAVEVVPLTATVRAPLLGAVELRPRRVRPGRRLALRFELSEDARVRAVLERGVPGRRRGRRCVAGGGSGLRGRRCRSWVGVRTIPRRGVAGANRIRLRASAAGRPLAPGRYRLALTAADRFGNRSDEAYARFRVAAPRAPRRGRRPASAPAARA